MDLIVHSANKVRQGHIGGVSSAWLAGGEGGSVLLFMWPSLYASTTFPLSYWCMCHDGMLPCIKAISYTDFVHHPSDQLKV